jgi:mannose-6-phosphate isomerase
MRFTAPIKLTSARAWRTYIGGSRIDEIHGIKGAVDTQFPEEWIMSTIVARNPGRDEFGHEGMSFLAEQGISLRSFIESYPVEALGASHAVKIGSTTGVLVKIIDAAERLTVQVHPNRQQAMTLFNSQFGKTEAWHILGGRSINQEAPSIYMGFQEGITRKEWERCFHEQDIPALLGHMHHFDVEPGETYLIKGGVPHAIGKGCLLIEIQESTDYTIRVEKVTPAGLKIAEQACHQGLGFEKMFECFDYDGITRQEACRRWCIPPKILERTDGFIHSQLIGYGATPCFALERYDIAGTCEMKTDGVFCGLYVLSGEGNLRTDGIVTNIKGGDQFFVPASSKPYTIEAQHNHPIVVFRCFGPKL